MSSVPVGLAAEAAPFLVGCLRPEVLAVSRALGHTSIATTADVYGHWTPAMADRLAARMDAVLGG